MNHSIENSRLMRGFLLLTLFLSTSLSANAADYYCDFSVNGIYYQFISGKPDEVAVSYDNYETGKYGGNWTNYSGHITVPSTVTYNSVTYKVTAVTGHAFFDCSELQSVSLPNSITSIGYAAFADCPSLSWIELPNNLKEIGTCAFQGCINLRSITVPGSVYSIGAKAFYETAWYDNQPNGLIYAGNVAYQYKGTMPAETQIDIKEGTLGIADQCFYSCSGLTSITIPNSVIRIGSTAFNECNNLTSANLPENITEICSGTFQYCSKLTSIDIPNGVIEIGNHAFNGCSSMTSVSLGNNVTSIKEYAFYHCSGLNSIAIPKSVTYIGSSAFSYCSSLTSLNIPESVTTIGGSAFESCNGLTSISVETGNPNYDSRNNCNALIETETNTLFVGCMNTVIPNGVTSIASYAFYNCNSLITINIPPSVTSIGDRAFTFCSGLTDVYCYPDEIPNISTSTFEYSEISAMTLHVPEKLLEIYTTTSPWSGFGTIVPIGPYYADANVEAICVANWDTDGDGYLSYEEAEAVATLGEVFKGNESITSFDELQYFTGLTSIDESAFSGCSSLTTISIPKSVTSIAGDAFLGCSNLIDVYCFAEEVPQASISAFEGVNMASVTLHVPAASADSYWETSPWSDFGRVMSLDMQKIYYAISDESTSLNVAKIESETKARFTHEFNGVWEALYLPFSIDYEAINADFDLAEIDGVVQNDVDNDGIADITVLSIMGFRGQMTEPNTPYLIRAKNVGKQSISFDNITIYPTEEATFESSSLSTKYEYKGSYSTLDNTALTNSYIVQGGELVKGANSLAPCRWYMTATAKKGSLNLPNKIRIMPVEDVITGVDGLNSGLNHNERIYNLSGQRLNKMHKGINIIGGKKVVVK